MHRVARGVASYVVVLVAVVTLLLAPGLGLALESTDTIGQDAADVGTIGAGTAVDQAATGQGAAVEARPVAVTLATSGGQDASDVLDGSYDTSLTIEAGESLTVTSSDGQAIGGIYLRFYSIPGSWTLRFADATGSVRQQACGQNGFLHEYVVLEGGATASVELVFPSGAAICTLDAYTQGRAPAGVQAWNPPCAQADFMVCSTHADDEILWLGGVLATYAGGQGLATQVVYMNNYWNDVNNGGVKREHEKLDGLWTIGVRNYPINAPYGDTYADSLETAQSIYDQDEITAFFTEQVRRFKPLVVVSQDFDGEYGHGAHQLLALAVQGAVEHGADASYYPDSAQIYGVWDTPKTYYHLYDQNQITLDLRQPIANLGGMTAIEAQQAAYTKHETQAYTWFYVSDDPTDPRADEVNCSLFGLYRSTVGFDTGNDMLEHLTTYEQQAVQAAEAEAAAQAQAQAEAEARAAEEREASAAEREAEEPETRLNVPLLLIVAGVGVLLLVIAVLAIVLSRR